MRLARDLKMNVVMACALSVGLMMVHGCREVEARNLDAPVPIEWDQIDNIKNAASRIARIQRIKGAEAALQLISDCYKTHTLFTDYSQGFEACLIQDHLQTRALVEVYSRLQPDALKRIGAPSGESLMRANVARFAVSLGKYKFPKTYARDLRKLANEHGWPVFVAIVFPGVSLNTGETKSTPRPPKQR